MSFSKSFILNSIREIDFFPKIEDKHVLQRSKGGGVFTMLTMGLVYFLFAMYTYEYLFPGMTSTAIPDSSRDDKLDVSLDASVLNIPCDVLTLDVLDVTGKHEGDISSAMIEKQRIDKNRRSIGGWFHAKVRRRFDLQKATELAKSVREGEGCRIRASFQVSRVAGNFHLSCHGTELQLLAVMYGDIRSVNVSHFLNSLTFSPPGQKPLPTLPHHGVVYGNRTGIYEYFLKLVPVTYLGLFHTFGYDYSETTYLREIKDSMPGIYFMYDINPMRLVYHRKDVTLVHYLTQLCGIIGGIFVVGGMIKRPVESAIERFRQGKRLSGSLGR